ncbi:MAG: KpsF/GutQ family sugar-phosphate isomerase [Acidobacteria bacterium]|nr:KpsF/GutQ family sugar-phosphate isomerase [Acidobacteriota bacterium]
MSLETARRVFRIEAQAISGLAERLDVRFDRAIEILFSCKGRVVVTGMGKSGLIGRKISATLASTGTPSLFLHPAEALHGDLGMLVREDVLLAISYGGENDEMAPLVESAKRLGVKLVAVTGNPASTLATSSNVVLDIFVKEEACSLNLAPTASTAAALAMGDALAIALLERRGFNHDDFAALHPGGRLGKKLQRVENVMRAGDAIPRVSSSTKMPDVIYEMSKKGLGMTTVAAADGTLAGILTDGDLRRMMLSKKNQILEMTAAECMTANPVTIVRTELAGAALNLMEQKKITSVVVVDATRRIEGVLHIHDLWTLQLF